MTLLDLIIFALAVFRISELIVIDHGPFDIFFELRSWANQSEMDNGIKRNISNVITCVHCTGLWTSVFVIIGFYYFPSILYPIMYLFAVAGLQSVIARLAGRHS